MVLTESIVSGLSWLRLVSLRILRELIVRIAKDDPSPVELAIEVEESENNPKQK
jgi:hypothetical protein